MSHVRWHPVYFGLGSNLNQPVGQLQSAVAALDELDGLKLYVVSSLVQSGPVDGSDQPDYFNVVAAGMTHLEPLELLDHGQRIEIAQGRDHSAARWSARPIDIDLLFLGQNVCSDTRLVLPHSQLAQRAFVLLPLAEIAPHVSIPGLGPLAALLSKVDRATITPAGKLFPDAGPNGLS